MPKHTASHVDLVLLAAPRGWCAGVARAVEMVDQELAGPGAVYMRHPIVHNHRVVADLAARGAHVVEELADVPPESTVVVSAHGAPPETLRTALDRGLTLVDATCPLVSKVHAEVRRFASRGYTILVIGHVGHVEVIGTMAQAPESTVLVTSVEDVASIMVPDPIRVAWVSQTTLSITEFQSIARAIRERFPAVVEPRHDDICYATTNRQAAVVAIAERSDIVLVIGSVTSSNSLRMVERARECGVRAELVEDAAAIAALDLAGVSTVGLSSGASASEELVAESLAWFAAEHGARVEEVTVVNEDVTFHVPPPQAVVSAGLDH
jgi:4-hydroxy-3-methylbut-2-enyl diphosphate reductase